MALAEVLEAAEGLVAVLGAAAETVELVDKATDSFNTLKEKFKKVFFTSKYVPGPATSFAFSQTWLRYEDFWNILHKMRRHTFSSFSDVEILRALYGLLFTFNSNLAFSSHFPDDDYFVCLSIDDHIVKTLMKMQNALSIKPKDTNEDFNIAKEKYFTALSVILEWANNKDNLYDRERFELEFNLILS